MTRETGHQDSACTQVLLFWTQPSTANESIYSQKTLHCVPERLQPEPATQLVSPITLQKTPNKQKAISSYLNNRIFDLKHNASLIN